MASTYTTNYNLEKPDPNADININPINSDLDLIDQVLSGKANIADRVVFDRNKNASLADCNTVENVGFYRIISSTQNAPFSYGILLHMQSNDYIRQIAIGNEYYFRVYRSSGWDSWQKLVTTDEIMNIVNKFTTTAVINFDTETRFYVYFNGTSSTGTKPWNSNNNGHLITFVRDSTNTVLQFARSQSPSDYKLYMRLKNGGTWGAWKSITFA